MTVSVPEPDDARGPVSAIAGHCGIISDMRYALTGGTGFVGGRLAALLVKAGHEVVAVVRDPSRATGLAALGVSLVRGDVTELAGLRTAAEGADGFFHVAGWYHLGAKQPEQAWRTNVDGTRVVLDAVRQTAVPRLVYTSTLAVNSDTGGRVVDETYRFTGKHLSVYDETKAQAHDLVAQAAGNGTPVVTVMPGLVYGPGDTSQTGAMLQQLLRGKRVLVTAGGQVCWGFIDDTAAGHLLAMERGSIGQSYMLAGPPHPLAEALRMAARMAGKPAPLVLPVPAVKAVQAFTGALERVLPLPGIYSAEALRSLLATYLGTPAKAERELGWSARSLHDGLTDTIRAA
jgi:nucleoside-diphosphate-sugar epimerase